MFTQPKINFDKSSKENLKNPIKKYNTHSKSLSSLEKVSKILTVKKAAQKPDTVLSSHELSKEKIKMMVSYLKENSISSKKIDSFLNYADVKPQNYVSFLRNQKSSDSGNSINRYASYLHNIELKNIDFSKEDISSHLEEARKIQELFNHPSVLDNDKEGYVLVNNADPGNFYAYLYQRDNQESLIDVASSYQKLLKKSNLEEGDLEFKRNQMYDILYNLYQFDKSEKELIKTREDIPEKKITKDIYTSLADLDKSNTIEDLVEYLSTGITIEKKRVGEDNRPKIKHLQIEGRRRKKRKDSRQREYIIDFLQRNSNRITSVAALYKALYTKAKNGGNAGATIHALNDIMIEYIALKKDSKHLFEQNKPLDRSYSGEKLDLSTISAHYRLEDENLSDVQKLNDDAISAETLNEKSKIREIFTFASDIVQDIQLYSKDKLDTLKNMISTADVSEENKSSVKNLVNTLSYIYLKNGDRTIKEADKVINEAQSILVEADDYFLNSNLEKINRLKEKVSGTVNEFEQYIIQNKYQMDSRKVGVSENITGLTDKQQLLKIVYEKYAKSLAEEGVVDELVVLNQIIEEYASIYDNSSMEESLRELKSEENSKSSNRPTTIVDDIDNSFSSWDIGSLNIKKAELEEYIESFNMGMADSLTNQRDRERKLILMKHAQKQLQLVNNMLSAKNEEL